MQDGKKSWAIIYFSDGEKSGEVGLHFPEIEIRVVGSALKQEEYIRLLRELTAEVVVLVDGKRVTAGTLNGILQSNRKQTWDGGIGYIPLKKRKLWLGTIRNAWGSDPDITESPVFIGEKSIFLQAYGGNNLADSILASVGYSLQKLGGVRFHTLIASEELAKERGVKLNKWKIRTNYLLCLPFHYLISGEFFRCFFSAGGKVQRDMVFRMLFLLFACFTFVFMPYISKDYGVTGDEFVDHRHAGYVLDYFTKGDKAALNQPKTVLHLYGNCVQVITGAICRYFNVDNYYELRHYVGGFVGALGILFTGLIGLRWGGGLGGFITLLLMFFTPRFFGHSMNNLKDVPFAVGYVIAIYYTIRLFDRYPRYHWGHIVGLMLGIALAMGTRSGGLILYPMLFMFAGLFYIQQYGVKEFYKFGKYRQVVGNILEVILLVIVGSYVLSILLWPFALQKPIGNVLYSLEKFTNYSIGLRTIFDGEQMMSNMLPWKYAPKYLCIGMPIVTLIGFFGFFLYVAIFRKKFSLIGFFLLFSAVFPVFWVIYKHSNLYGGIRHLLFVMPPMVAVAGYFWSEMIGWAKRYAKLIIAIVFAGLLFLPLSHMIRNHPNDYVYFNEFKGGLSGAYGDYETDYYFNSLKMATDWFKKNVLPDLPKDKKTIIVTQAAGPLEYYFRKDTNIRVVYSRYYEKYSKDWDYAIFANVYISQFQLKNGLFPPEGTLYAPSVDGFPMSFVAKRDTKRELLGFELEQQKKYVEALQIFQDYIVDHKSNEEIWSRMGKLYYITRQLPEARIALSNALELHPFLNESLYMLTLVAMDQKDYKTAFESVGKMLSENSSSADAWYLRASIYYQLRQYQNAIKDLNRLLSFRPNYERAHVLAGNIFRDNGDYKQAAKMYERAIKYKNSISSQVQLADVLARMRNYQEAENILQKMSQVQASYYPIYKVRARIALMKGNYEEAGKYLTELQQIENDVELYVLWGAYYNATHQSERAHAALEMALKMDPGHPEALALKKEIK